MSTQDQRIAPVAPGAPPQKGKIPIPGLVRALDSVTVFCARVVSLLIYPLIFALVYEVFSRYLFHAPTLWAYDTSYFAYGTFFMLGSSYALYRKAHIRTDILYRLLPVRWQGMIDAFCYLFLFFPGMILFLSAGWNYFLFSWTVGEKSPTSALLWPFYPFKFVIPLTAVLLLLQGIAETLKSVYASVRGEWL